MNRVVEIALFTEHPEHLVDFYAALLEAEPAQRWPGGATFQLGGLTLLIHVREPDTAGGPANRDHVAIGVEDVDGAVKRLRARGIDVEDAADFDWGRSAYLRDPEGRMLELHSPG